VVVVVLATVVVGDSVVVVVVVVVVVDDVVVVASVVDVTWEAVLVVSATSSPEQAPSRSAQAASPTASRRALGGLGMGDLPSSRRPGS
jgi:hypothetical protein